MSKHSQMLLQLTIRPTLYFKIRIAVGEKRYGPAFSDIYGLYVFGNTFRKFSCCLGPLVASCRKEHGAKRTCVADRMSADIVVEINKNLLQPRLPAFNPLGPCAQMRLWIISAIAASAAMKSDIGKIGGQFQRPGHLAPIMKAQRDIAVAKQFINLRREPALVAKLNRKSVAFRQYA